MKIEIWWIGSTDESYLKEGIAQYEKRIKHYLPAQTETLLLPKSAGKLAPDALKAEEADLVLKRLQTHDALVLLDERGKCYDSVGFADYINHWLNQSYHRLVFLIGGAYGFDQRVYDRAQAKLSLSQMTFSHQMVRLFLLEQLYRAMTILRNEPYHHA